jgi:hypothetical protein
MTTQQVDGRELGVRSVLTGRIQQRDDNLSVVVALVDTKDNTLIWRNMFSRSFLKPANQSARGPNPPNTGIHTTLSHGHCFEKVPFHPTRKRTTGVGFRLGTLPPPVEAPPIRQPLPENRWKDAGYVSSGTQAVNVSFPACPAYRELPGTRAGILAPSGAQTARDQPDPSERGRLRDSAGLAPVPD